VRLATLLGMKWKKQAGFTKVMAKQLTILSRSQKAESQQTSPTSELSLNDKMTVSPATTMEALNETMAHSEGNDNGLDTLGRNS
jgi:hypothetical protein